jgi:hypothetical protein
MVMGRPLGLTPEIAKEVIAMIGNGVPYAVAIEAAGFCEKTIYNWLSYGIRDRNEGKDTIFVEFLQSIKRVEASFINELLGRVKEGVDRWQSCAWILERRYRQHFGVDAGIIQELMESFKQLEAKLDEKRSST